MDPRWTGLHDLLAALGGVEEPLGFFYTAEPPADAFAPQTAPTPTKEREDRGEIDWQATFANFSCCLGHLWRARIKRRPAVFSAQRFGCPGAAFWLGFLKPQTDFVAHYVSTGFPGRLPGERYLASPADCRALFDLVDPEPAPAPYLVAKPLGLFAPSEHPLIVAFFARAEAMAGLHQLASFATGRMEVVRSPFSAACGSLLAWPLHYLARGQQAAVLGGWDPSARKYFRPDELSLAMPTALFEALLAKWPQSFLTAKAWRLVLKKMGAGRA